MTTPGTALNHIIAINAEHVTEIVRFFVPGKPATAGSKQSFVHPKLRQAIKNGKADSYMGAKTVTAPDSKKSGPWMTDVKMFALQAWGQRQPMQDGAVLLSTEFVLTRRSGDFGTGRNAGRLKVSAETWVRTRPDESKYIRCLEDALTGLVWKDDGQVALHISGKRYAAPDEQLGVHVTVYQINQPILKGVSHGKGTEQYEFGFPDDVR